MSPAATVSADDVFGDVKAEAPHVLRAPVLAHQSCDASFTDHWKLASDPAWVKQSEESGDNEPGSVATHSIWYLRMDLERDESGRLYDVHLKLSKFFRRTDGTHDDLTDVFSFGMDPEEFEQLYEAMSRHMKRFERALNNK